MHECCSYFLASRPTTFFFLVNSTTFCFSFSSLMTTWTNPKSLILLSVSPMPPSMHKTAVIKLTKRTHELPLNIHCLISLLFPSFKTNAPLSSPSQFFGIIIYISISVVAWSPPPPFTIGFWPTIPSPRPYGSANPPRILLRPLAFHLIV